MATLASKACQVRLQVQALFRHGLKVESGSLQGHKPAEPEQFPRALPEMKFRQGVGANDKDQLIIRVALGQGANGVDGVGGAAAPDFQVAHLERERIGQGGLQHGHTVLDGHQRSRGFMGGMIAGHKQHGGKIECLQGILRQDQVAEMDRIERAA